MSYDEQIVNELLAIDAALSTYTIKLEGAREEIINTINKVQNTFGNQRESLILATTLYKTLQNVVNSDSALFVARQEIKKYVLYLQK